MLADDAQILRVRLVEKVEDIAGKGDGADQRVDADIGGHAGELPFRQAEIAGFPHDPGAHGGGRDVADDGNETDQAVHADPVLRAGNDEQPLQHGLHHLDPATDRGGVAAEAGHVTNKVIELLGRNGHSITLQSPVLPDNVRRGKKGADP